MPSKKITVKTSEVLIERNEFQQKGLDLPHVSLTKEGVVPKSERYERDFLVKDEEKDYKVTRIGDLCYNPANLKFGVITLNEKYNGIFSPIYVTFEINKKLMTNLYAKYFFIRHNFIGKLMRYQQGTVYERMSVSPEDFVRDSITIHTLSEQEKIGAFLSAIDRLIGKQKEKVDHIKTLKKGYLQRIFPQVSAQDPTIRFLNKNTSWKTTKFSSITFFSGKRNIDNLPLESYSISNENGFIPQNIQFENGGSMIDADKRMYYIVSPNSFAYNPARINVGSIGYQNNNKDVIVSSLYEVFKTTQGVNDDFLWHWFKSSNFQRLIHKYQEGGVRLYFYYDKLCLGTIAMPNLYEQRKIGLFFNIIDKLLKSEETSLLAYERLKSFYIQKLFAYKEGNS